MRALIIFVLLPAVLLAPFVWTSLAVDQRGITIPGVVRSKREDVRMRENSWSRTSELTVSYEVPETSSAGFLTVNLTPEEYDAYHVGQPVSLHYLRSKDVPDFPTSRVMREMHLLPTVRLANQQAFSFLDQAVPAPWLFTAGAVLAVILVLALWRFIWPSTFWWPTGLAIAAALALFTFLEFPPPTPKPQNDLHQAEGKVKSITHITELLQSTRSRGIETKQPIDVVGVEFVPLDHRDPVLAVDLIDAGSLAGLNEGSAVRVVYESKSPRIAHLIGATRDFYRLNFQGASEQAMLALLVLGGFLVLWSFVRRLWKRARQTHA